MTPLLTTSDRFEGWSCLDDADAADDNPATADLHTAEYWDRSAAQMRDVVAHHESKGQWSRAAYYRPFIARFNEAAARIRRHRA